MSGKRMGYNDDVPKGRDVKDTQQLNTTARESSATGENSTKRYTSSHKPFGTLGNKGHSK
jgi:hypothetical protein